MGRHWQTNVTFIGLKSNHSEISSKRIKPYLVIHTIKYKLNHYSSWNNCIWMSDINQKTCECWDLNEISGESVGWKDPTNPKSEWDPFPNQQAWYFIQIFLQTLFLVLSHTLDYFQTHLVCYSSKLEWKITGKQQ